MNTELEAIKAVWQEKTAAKVEVMGALGKAKLADKNGEDSAADWDVVVKKGGSGVEGSKSKQAVDMSDAYVAAHPDEFVEYEKMDIAAVVKALSVFRSAGMEESTWRAQVWLWHKYEPQHIGGPLKAQVRVPGVG